MSALEELARRPLVVAEDLRLLADQMRHPDLAMVRQLERAAELLALLDRESAGVRIDARPGDLAAERDQARVELERLRAIEKRARGLVTINEPVTSRTARVILGEQP